MGEFFGFLMEHMAASITSIISAISSIISVIFLFIDIEAAEKIRVSFKTALKVVALVSILVFLGSAVYIAGQYSVQRDAGQTEQNTSSTNDPGENKSSSATDDSEDADANGSEANANDDGGDAGTSNGSQEGSNTEPDMNSTSEPPPAPPPGETTGPQDDGIVPVPDGPDTDDTPPLSTGEESYIIGTLTSVRHTDTQPVGCVIDGALYELTAEASMSMSADDLIAALEKECKAYLNADGYITRLEILGAASGGTEQLSPTSAVVPDVIGLEQGAATNLIYMNCLQFQVWWTFDESEGSDTLFIVSQEPEAGEVVEMGTVVRLELSPHQPGSVASAAYITDDAAVKSADELGYYLFKTPILSVAAQVDLATNEVTNLDYITEKLCHVLLMAGNTDLSGAELYIGAEDGVLLSLENDEGCAELYINKGRYRVLADFGGYSVEASVHITGSGLYTLDFY